MDFLRLIVLADGKRTKKLFYTHSVFVTDKAVSGGLSIQTVRRFFQTRLTFSKLKIFY